MDRPIYDASIEIETLRARVASLEAALARASANNGPARTLWGSDQLAEREELLREAEHIAGVGSWAWDIRNGTVAWSDELYRILGLCPVSGPASFERFMESVHPDDRANVHALSQRAAAGDVPAHADYRIVRPDGTTRDIRGIAQIFRDANGVPHRMVGVALDVTERMRLESDLAQVQKLDALGRLAGGIAHDFNNLLTVILLNLASARHGARDDERLASAHAAATQAAALTSQLLAFSRHSVRRAVPVDVNRAVSDAMQLVTRLINESIRTRFHPCRERAVVRADPTQLTQIVLNLAVNARDAMPSGGELTIDTSVVSREPYGAEATRVFVRLAVRDTGTGMDAATRARLFEPFFTTKEPGRGTGLGLATVFGIATQSGGFVEVCSTPGRGSAFSVYLPLCDDEVDEPAETVTDHSAARRGHLVLLVEDDAGVRAVIDSVLRSGGYDVLVAASPDEALEKWGVERDRISVLVSDIVMPGRSGHEVLAELRRDRPRLPAIFVSGYDPIGSERDDVRCLRKPFTREELLDALTAVLA